MSINVLKDRQVSERKEAEARALHETREKEKLECALAGSVEILSKVRHPHLLILLGACIDHGCFVYEYMENGSLDDRLFRKDSTRSIPWFEASYCLGSSFSTCVPKPKQVIHRDLKPANILLDHNLVSKIGDVGRSLNNASARL
ncbi:hypothetical protein ACET3Z_026712 [Daucus carota]